MGNIFSFFLCFNNLCEMGRLYLNLLDHISNRITLWCIFSKNMMPSVMLLKIVKQDLQDKESFDGSPWARQFDVQ